MSMTKNELLAIPANEFGLPKERKFPMQDEKHLRAAIAYFYTAKPEKRKELAKNIIRRHQELKSDVKISKKNPLFKYVPEEMKNLNESSTLFENVNVEHFGQMFGPKGKEIAESLLTKTDLGDVDDIDAQVPDDYRQKQLFANTMKSYILNELGDKYPVVYMDYNVSKKDLQKNNGGIRTLSETSVLLDYRTVLNEATGLDIVKDIKHIQFCALLREWDEGYCRGHRNPTYDRLMIETWKSQVKQLLESIEDNTDNIGQDSKIKVNRHSDIETSQKLIDLGVKDVGKYVKKDDDKDLEPIRKAAEIGFNLTDDMVDKYRSAYDDGDVMDKSLDLTLYSTIDNVSIPQKGKDITFQDLWKLS